MFELDLGDAFLKGLVTAGPQLLALAALVCALGLPLPMPMLVLAAGAIVRQDGSNPLLMIAACLAGSLLGESIYYTAGRYAGAWIQGHAGRLVAGAWQGAQERFGAQAALTVYLTRFLLTPIGIPTNLIAGSRRYAYWRFALCALAGDLMWVTAYGLAGYLVGSSWQAVSATVTSYGASIAGVVAAGVALRYLWQNRTRSERMRLHPVLPPAERECRRIPTLNLRNACSRAGRL